jgi:hypothetical protein
MTAQIADTFRYQGKELTLAGISGAGLFDPADHGLNPKSWSTACWRGYRAHYMVMNEKLTLTTLEVSLTHPRGFHDGTPVRATAPTINGITPPILPESELTRFEYKYKGLDLLIPYSGGLLLASDFIDELYVHMGFHPAWKYRHVHELIFESGVLEEERDVSEKMSAIRRKMLAMPPEGDGSSPPPGSMAWIEKCFSQDYNF